MIDLIALIFTINCRKIHHSIVVLRYEMYILIVYTAYSRIRGRIQPLLENKFVLPTGLKRIYYCNKVMQSNNIKNSYTKSSSTRKRCIVSHTVENKFRLKEQLILCIPNWQINTDFVRVLPIWLCWATATRCKIAKTVVPYGEEAEPIQPGNEKNEKILSENIPVTRKSSTIHHKQFRCKEN